MRLELGSLSSLSETKPTPALVSRPPPADDPHSRSLLMCAWRWEHDPITGQPVIGVGACSRVLANRSPTRGDASHGVGSTRRRRGDAATSDNTATIRRNPTSALGCAAFSPCGASAGVGAHCAARAPGAQVSRSDDSGRNVAQCDGDDPGRVRFEQGRRSRPGNAGQAHRRIRNNRGAQRL